MVDKYDTLIVNKEQKYERVMNERTTGIKISK